MQIKHFTQEQLCTINNNELNTTQCTFVVKKLDILPGKFIPLHHR